MIEPDRPEGGPTQHQAHDPDTVHLAEIHERPARPCSTSSMRGSLRSSAARPRTCTSRSARRRKIRDAGALIPLDHAPLGNDEATTIVEAIVPPERRERLETSGEIDFAYSLAGVGRFRVNAFRQRGSYSAVLRKLRFGGPGFDEMGLPDVIRQLADEPRGLVLSTFDQSLLGLVKAGKVSVEAALGASSNPHDFTLQLQQARIPLPA